MNNHKLSIEERTFIIGTGIIKLVDLFPQKTSAYVLGKQIIRSGTSIHSNIIHAKCGLTRKEFTYFLNISKMEAKETKSWLLMAIAVDLIPSKFANETLQECEEIIKILVKSIKTLQNKK